MGILEPLKVTITNWEGGVKEVAVVNHPKLTIRGSHSVPLSNVIYIERSDFRLEDAKGYKRLAPNKTVGLTHVGASLKCTDVVKDNAGNVIELKATIDFAPKDKAQGFIHWVSQPSPGEEPLTVEVRCMINYSTPESLEVWKIG